MKKQQHSLNDFLSREIPSEKTNQIKGGHADVRRPSTTTTTGIWDDVEIRSVKNPFFLGGNGKIENLRG